MTNDRTVTAKYLSYNQGVTTTTPANNANRSTSSQAGFQQSSRQLSAPSQTIVKFN